eukprot:scaffold119109_cov68-Phaeocystis_antarctica.AAC.14
MPPGERRAADRALPLGPTRRPTDRGAELEGLARPRLPQPLARGPRRPAGTALPVGPAAAAGAAATDKALAAAAVAEAAAAAGRAARTRRLHPWKSLRGPADAP